MEILNNTLKRLESNVEHLQDGLQPENLSFWYEKIIKETQEIAPPWLQNKIGFVQDPILPQKFNLDLSKRSLKYFATVVNDNFDDMPYSTRLYFIKVLELIQIEHDKSLV
ncbi:MAG: hypothetical protein R1F52_04900 [Candidatus Nitrosoabyssus spongiisocia]|nr:MAG: hypothetical protein R1F52_04900 [Nitrosopumilaceae archaeon AB1(1)]